jgi:regulator of RNase E activity RraA
VPLEDRPPGGQVGLDGVHPVGGEHRLVVVVVHDRRAPLDAVERHRGDLGGGPRHVPVARAGGGAVQRQLEDHRCRHRWLACTVSKSHPVQWAVHDKVERPDPALVAALRELATTQIADSGAPVGVVGPGLHRLAGGAEVCGPAVTVWTKPGDILFVLKATDMIAPGDVLVVDGGGREDAAVIGDIVGQTIADLGCVGVVVDGAVRDVDGLDAAGLPTFARGVHPATGSNQGPGAINVAVQCGGVAVRPGDVVRADSSGIVVVPRDHLPAVVTAVRAVADREEAWRAAIADGQSLPSATGIDDLLATLHEGREPPLP